MELPDAPFDPVVDSLVALVVALPAAFLISLALLWIYLRAVKRSMLRRAAGKSSTEPPRSADCFSGQTVGPPKRALDIVSVDAAVIPGKWSVTRRMWLVGTTYAIAGLAFAYVLATAFALANGLGFDWRAVSSLSLIYTWPIVITIGLVCIVSWLGLGLLVLGYALVLAATTTLLAWGTTV